MSSSRNQAGSGLQPGRRKAARGRTTMDSDEEAEATHILEDSPRHLRQMKSRRPEDEDDFDIDIGDESPRFSTSPSDEEMAEEFDTRNPPPPSSRPQPRRKLPSAKFNKSKTGKKSRRAVISDDDDEEDEDSMPWRSDMSGEEDPPSSPPQTRAVASSSTRTRKGRARADFEDIDSLQIERPAATGMKRPRPLDSEPAIDSKPPSPLAGPDATVATENKEPVLKKKLPPIKKIKLSDSSASSPVPTSKATPAPAKTEKSKFTAESSGLPPPPSSLPRKPAATAGNADLDLLNADVYKQLFSTASAPPKSGVKEKEERMRELHRMRDEAHAKRQQEAVVSFNLAAQHDKIEAFTRRLEARRSPAIWPNTLAAKFKADMQEKMRAEQKAKQQQHQIPAADRKSNWTAA